MAKQHPVRIAANDPTLARAMSSAEIEKLRRGSAKVFARINRRMTIGAISKALLAHFGALLIDEHIVRRHGSRAEAHWVILDAMGPHWFMVDALDDESQWLNDLIVGRLMYDKTGLHRERPPLQISPHVVARFFHRTQGHSDIRGLALLKRHLSFAWNDLLREALKPGDEMATTTAEGAMMWRAFPHRLHPFMLRATTWISAGTAVDPVLKKSMREAG